MSWKIVADSACDIIDLDRKCPGLSYASIPFVFTVDDRSFTDDEHFDTRILLDALAKARTPSKSSCPSPDLWADEFKTADYSIAITISAELSGSYNSACAAREMVLEEFPEKKIAVVNCRSTGPGNILIAEKAADLIAEGIGFDEIVQKLNEYVSHVHTVFALCSFDNLIRNGRMPRLVGIAARALHLWGIGIGTPGGKIELIGKARGGDGAVNSIIKDYSEKHQGGRCLYISHCRNPKVAEKIRDQVMKMPSPPKVRIFETRGLDTFYAENEGIIVSYDGILQKHNLFSPILDRI